MKGTCGKTKGNTLAIHSKEKGRSNFPASSKTGHTYFIGKKE
jgi:hypothetical protein